MKKNLLLLFYLFYTTIAFSQEPKSSFVCGVNDAVLPPKILEQMQKAPIWLKQRATARTSANERYICRIAIEIDSDTYEQFNKDTTLIKYEAYKQIERISKIYEKEINTQLVVTYVNIWKDAAKDPYRGTFDIFKMLETLKKTWANDANLKSIRTRYDKVMYLVSKGFDGAGGVAYLGGRESVSPWGENGDSRGLMVVAHELGHNFGSPHTQNCSWPGGVIDYCYPAESNCYQNALEGIRGSIMSYCSYAPTFHPLCQALMQNHAATNFQKVSSFTAAPVLPKTFTFDNTTTLTWDAVLSAEKYIFEISQEADFGTKLLSDTTFINAYNFTGVKSNQKYYIRIKAFNTFGESNWSNISSLTTPATTLLAPNLIFPLDKAANLLQNSNLTLTFGAVPSASSYEIEVTSYNDQYFKKPLVKGTVQINAFTFKTPFYNELLWRVRAVSGTNKSAWSEVNTIWLRNNTDKIVLPNAGVGVPLTFPISYNGNSIIAGATVRFTLSLKDDFSQPIFIKSFPPNKYLSYNYVCMAQNLSPNTNYYVKVEEVFDSKDGFDHVRSIPNGVLFLYSTKFTTGSTKISEQWSFINNDTKETFDRDIKSFDVGSKGVFIKNIQGLVRIDTDSLNIKTFDRNSSSGTIGNKLNGISSNNTDNSVWVLNTLSKRIEFDGVFPKTTYSLAQVNQQTGEKISTIDLSNPEDTSPYFLDMKNKLIYGYTNGGYSLSKIVDGKINSLVKFKEVNKYFYQPVWNNKYAWTQVYDYSNSTWELRRYDLMTQTFTAYNNSNTPTLGNFYFDWELDSKGNLWSTMRDNSYKYVLVKFDGTSWQVFDSKSNSLINSPNQIAIDKSDNIHLLDNKRILKYDGTNWKKLGDFPFLDNFKEMRIDEKEKVWFVYDYGLLRFNPVTVEPQSIATSTIAGSPFCLGTKVNVAFTAQGTFNTGNVFTAQLSDKNGSFTTPVSIGTLTSVANAGTIAVTIPQNTINGDKYRIRVVSSNPSVIGTDNGSNLSVVSLASGSLSDNQTIITGDKATLKVSLTGTSPWSVVINNQTYSNITTSPYTLTVAPTATTKYTLSKVTNTCGTVNLTANNEVTVTVNPQLITTSTIVGSPFCLGTKVNVAFTANGTFNTGNIFSVQLSDQNGSFTAPVSIGSLTRVANAGTITATIPQNTINGDKYRIRVVSSNPSVIGSDNGSNLSVVSLASGSLSDNQTIISGDKATLKVGLTGTSPWSVVINNQTYSNITTSPYTITVAPTATTKYTLSKVTNTCGTVNLTTNNVVTVTVNPKTIATSAIVGSPFCLGTKVDVAFTANGTFNTGNIFSVQLSDQNGRFTSPVSIGSLTSVANAGTIAATIPQNTINGDKYRIRVVSSDPSVIGSDNGSNLSIVSLASGSLSDNQTIISGDKATLKVGLTGTSPWSVVINNQTYSNITTSPYTLTVAPTATTKYTLSKVTNTCGTVNLTANNEVTVTVNPQLITTSTIVGSPFCLGTKVNVAFTANGTFNTGNIFSVQLSDQNGSFTAPVSIGSLTRVANAGTITATIPQNTINGDKYRIRVVSSNPSVIGSDNGSNLSIVSLASGSLSDNQTIISGDKATLKVSLTGTSPWSVVINNQTYSNITTSPYTITVAPTATTKYTLSKVTNTCGTVNLTTNNVVTVTVNPQLITTSTIVGSPFCLGTKVNVAFTANGTFNTGNIFSVQLSDQNGSFTTPVSIGSLTSVANAGTITATIPQNTINGDKYRIRVVSSDPSVIGSDNGSNLSIVSLASGSLSDNQTIISGDKATLKVGLTGTSPWSVVINNQTYSNITTSPYTITVAPTATTKYTLSKVTNTCGTVNLTTNNEVTVTVNPQLITTSTIVGSPFCLGTKVNVAFTANGTFNTGNIFSVQLSDQNGSFTAPVSIGSLTRVANAGTITATIPQNTINGDKYRIRVVSSNPSVIGSDNGSNLSIVSLASGSLSDNQTIISGDKATLKVSLTGTSPWSVVINNQTYSNITTSPYTITVAPTATTKYTLSKVTNTCGTVNLTTNNVVTVTVNPKTTNAIVKNDIPLNVSQQKVDNIIAYETLDLKVFPNPTQGLLKIDYFSPVDEVVSLQVINTNGYIVQELKEQTQKGDNHFEITIGSSGTYIIYLQSQAGTTISKKIQVIR